MRFARGRPCRVGQGSLRNAAEPVEEDERTDRLTRGGSLEMAQRTRHPRLTRVRHAPQTMAGLSSRASRARASVTLSGEAEGLVGAETWKMAMRLIAVSVTAFFRGIVELACLDLPETEARAQSRLPLGRLGR